MPKGVVNKEKQLDALAAAIIGATEVERIAKKLKITKQGVYKLAKSAIKRLTPTDDARALKNLSTALVTIGIITCSSVGYAQSIMPMATTPCPINLNVSPGNGPYGFAWNNGVDDGTTVCLGRGLSNVQGSYNQTLHVFLLTGTQPSNQGTIGPLPVGGLYGNQGLRPTCISQPVWTMPEYTVDRPIPDWPIQSTAIVNAYDQNHETIMLHIWSPEALDPNANYSVNVICGIKQ